MKVKFKKLHPDCKLPTKANPTDACYDVWAVSVESKDSYLCYKLGFSTEIPPGWQMKVYMRSSVSKKDLSLCNAVATIDAPYRGEWELRFNTLLPNEVIMCVTTHDELENLESKDEGWKPNVYDLTEAIAQIELVPVYDIEWEETDTLSTSDRGEGGFGSSNRKKDKGKVKNSFNPELDGDGS